MVKKVNERPADEFGNHKANLDDLGYTDEEVEKAQEASEHANAIRKLYKNSLIICSDSNCSDMDGGFGTGLISAYFGGAKTVHEQKLMLENWLTALVENFIEGGMLGNNIKNKPQVAYDMFSKLAGYYAYQFPDKVKDRFEILKGVDITARNLADELKMSPKDLEKSVRDKLKKRGVDLDDPNIKIVPASSMNESQLRALFTMLGADPEELLDKIHEEDGIAEVGRLNLDKMTESQKKALATLLDINLNKLERKKKNGRANK